MNTVVNILAAIFAASWRTVLTGAFFCGLQTVLEHIASPAPNWIIDLSLKGLFNAAVGLLGGFLLCAWLAPVIVVPAVVVMGPAGYFGLKYNQNFAPWQLSVLGFAFGFLIWLLLFHHVRTMPRVASAFFCGGIPGAVAGYYFAKTMIARS